MKKLLQKKEGFTLIELLIVVAIIGIVAGIAIPRFLGARTTARVTRAFADMRTIGDALEMYFIDNSAYPVPQSGGSVTTDLADAIGATPDLGSYITSIPTDPFGTATVPNFRYYSNGDATTTATMWLIVSNGPDGDTDVSDTTNPSIDFTGTTIGGELGGPNGATGTYYGCTLWSVAGSASDNGDIGRGGP